MHFPVYYNTESAWSIPPHPPSIIYSLNHSEHPLTTYLRRRWQEQKAQKRRHSKKPHVETNTQSECNNRGGYIEDLGSRRVSHQGFERGLFCGFIGPGVVCEFGEGKIVTPIVLLMVDPESQVLFDPLVSSLQLSIHTRMIGCGNILGNTQ